MFRNLSVTRKVILIFASVAIIMLAAMLIFFNHAFKATLEKTYSQAEENLKKQLQEQIERRKVVSITNAIALAGNGILIEGMKTGNRAAVQASLEKILNDYQQYSSFNLSLIHI